MREEIIPDLKQLTNAEHEKGAAVSNQLGHCWYFASPSVIGKGPLGASPKFNLFRLPYCVQMTKQDIEEKIGDFANAAKIVTASGFDDIDIHVIHGYLIRQLLSPFTKKCKNEFGGALKNRNRFPEEIIKRIRKILGEGFPILVKMNLRDGMKGAQELNEAIKVAKMFETAGANAINPSNAFTSKPPFECCVANSRYPAWLPTRKTGL